MSDLPKKPKFEEDNSEALSSSEPSSPMSTKLDLSKSELLDSMERLRQLRRNFESSSSSSKNTKSEMEKTDEIPECLDPDDKLSKHDGISEQTSFNQDSAKSEDPESDSTGDTISRISYFERWRQLKQELKNFKDERKLRRDIFKEYEDKYKDPDTANFFEESSETDSDTEVETDSEASSMDRVGDSVKDTNNPELAQETGETKAKESVSDVVSSAICDKKDIQQEPDSFCIAMRECLVQNSSPEKLERLRESLDIWKDLQNDLSRSSKSRKRMQAVTDVFEYVLNDHCSPKTPESEE